MMDIAQIIKELKSRKLKLATAESCTGGRISAAFTAVSGASDVFQGGIVAYQPCIKTEFLKVPQEIIERFKLKHGDKYDYSRVYKKMQRTSR